MSENGPFLRKLLTATLLLQCIMKPSQESELISFMMYSENVVHVSGKNFIAQCLSMRCF